MQGRKRSFLSCSLAQALCLHSLFCLCSLCWASCSSLFAMKKRSQLARTLLGFQSRNHGLLRLFMTLFDGLPCFILRIFLPHQDNVSQVLAGRERRPVGASCCTGLPVEVRAAKSLLGFRRTPVLKRNCARPYTVNPEPLNPRPCVSCAHSLPSDQPADLSLPVPKP